MLFNSLEFFYFFLIVFPLYCILGQKARKVLLLLASYYFYMCWNINYVFLILLSTITSYFASIGIEATKNRLKKKVFLWSSIIISLSILCFFKYYNFFASSINEISSFNLKLMNFLLPVGISFYTFETFSYTIDVYNNKLKAEKNFWIYSLFISFFPKLVAGPIERSENLIPQFHRETSIKTENIIVGTKYIILGFFMKLVVADRLSIYVDSVYNNVDSHFGLTFLIATLCFSFQILCDFAGYSTIALGVAKLFDYQLMLNFKRPYFSLTFSEFWRRWHISLSSWFRDYVYIPLGGNRGKKIKVYRNLFLTFLISGLWHGANWTFVVWGAFHGIFLVFENIIFSKQKNTFFEKYFITRVIKRIFIFIMVSFAWIFFRANSLSDAIKIITKSFDFKHQIFSDSSTLFFGVISILILLLIDNRIERNSNNNEFTSNKLTVFSILIFSFLLIMIFYFGVFDGGQFIYFQF